MISCCKLKLLTGNLILQIGRDGIISSTHKVGLLTDYSEFPRDDSTIVPIIAPLWVNFRPLTFSYRVTEQYLTKKCNN